MEKNNIWDLTTLPPGKEAVGCKWEYKVKCNSDGSVERFKARLVAKGFTQVVGEDYTEVFSPVAKIVSVRLFIALAAARGWNLHQLDVNNAFLHGNLDEDIYMLPPPDYLKAEKGMVCRLKKSIYSLKQASRQWNLEFTSKLQAFGFLQSCHDHCLFRYHKGDNFLFVLVYVDDVLLTGSDPTLMEEVKSYLDRAFMIKILAQPSTSLVWNLLAQIKVSMSVKPSIPLIFLGMLECWIAHLLLPLSLRA